MKQYRIKIDDKSYLISKVDLNKLINDGILKPEYKYDRKIVDNLHDLWMNKYNIQDTAYGCTLFISMMYNLIVMNKKDVFINSFKMISDIIKEQNPNRTNWYSIDISKDIINGDVQPYFINTSKLDSNITKDYLILFDNKVIINCVYESIVQFIKEIEYTYNLNIYE